MPNKWIFPKVDFKAENIRIKETKLKLIIGAGSERILNRGEKKVEKL